jgi:CDP-paratose 2-epimerase
VNRGFLDTAAPVTEPAPADHRHWAAPANPEIGFALWPFFGDHAGIEAAVADMVELARGRPVMARVQVSWADWARPGDGPRWLDDLLNRLHDAGIEIFPTFMWTPPSLGMAPISSAAPRDPGAFAWFVGHVLERYGRLISPYVQFWNEANGSCYWVRDLDPSFEIFARMHIQAARVAREEHGRKVVLAGVIPAGGPQWIDQMRGHGVLEHTDLLAVHGFPGTWLPRRIGWRHLLERADQVLRRHGMRCPIWICEASYSTMRRPGRRSLEHEFRQLTTFRKLLGLPVERVFWHTLRDLPPSRRSAIHAHDGSYDPREHGCGLRYCDGTPKMLWNAWRTHGLVGIRNQAYLDRPLRELIA